MPPVGAVEQRLPDGLRGRVIDVVDDGLLLPQAMPNDPPHLERLGERRGVVVARIPPHGPVQQHDRGAPEEEREQVAGDAAAGRREQQQDDEQDGPPDQPACSRTIAASPIGRSIVPSSLATSPATSARYSL